MQHEHLILVDQLLGGRDALGLGAGIVLEDSHELATVNATLVAQRQNEEIRELTETSIAQGEEVKKISAWAAILFAPTLVGTVYGMNFDWMPELHWQWGYPVSLVLMLGVSVTLYLVFKRRDWI